MTNYTRTAHGYQFDYLGNPDRDWYLWDLGVIYAVGPESGPISPSSGLTTYQGISTDETTPETLSEREPDITTDITLIECDYSMYMAVPFENATHLIDPDTGAPAKITTDIDIGEESGVVLTTREHTHQKTEAVTHTELQTRIETHDWQPAIRIAN